MSVRILPTPIPSASLASYRRGHDFFSGPTQFPAIDDDMFAPAHFIRPCAEALSATVPSDHRVASPITRVFFGQNPSNIPWFVVAVCVYAVKLVGLARMLANSCANIFCELGVKVPRLMHFDAPSSIKGVGIMSRATASMFHASPSNVHRRTDFPVLRAFPTSYTHLHHIGAR